MEKVNDEIFHRMRLYIPNNIDLDNLLMKHPIDVANARDYLAYILHLIHAVPAFNKDSNIEDNNGYTLLSSKLLQSKVDNYKVLINWLVSNGILEVNNSYESGKRSKGYRLTTNYQTETKAIYITTRTLIRRLRYKTKSEDTSILKPEHLIDLTPDEVSNQHLGYSKLAEIRLSYLNDWFNENLKIDTDLAEQYLRQLLHEITENKEVKFPMHKFNCWKMALDYFKYPFTRFNVDDTTGRLHTPLTSLKSELRALITYAGEPMASVDIKNSQPLLSLTLIDENLLVKNKMIDRIAIYNEKFKCKENRNKNLYTMLGNLIKENSNKEDVLKYKELVLSGKVYEYFGENLQNIGEISRSVSKQECRKLAKKQFFRCFFGNNQSLGHNKAQQVFKEIFPSVYDIFKVIKSGNYKTLACVLQNLESEIILHKCCKGLSEIIPESQLYTIHDSVASVTKYIDTIYEAVSNSLFEVLEVRPELKVEYWNEEFMQNSRQTQNQNNSSSTTQVITEGLCSYGYCDYEALYCVNYIPLSKVAGILGLKRNKFWDGLRKLGIIRLTENLPTKEYEEARLFKSSEFKIKLKRSFGYLTCPSVKVTDKGFEFLQKLVEENPELFPKKRAKKRTKRS